MGVTAEQQRARDERKALLAEIQRDRILDEWMNESVRERASVVERTAGLSAAERDVVAVRAGYRTWRQYWACLEDMHRAVCLFRESPTFKNLWKQLRTTDAKACEHELPLVGRYNGALPLKILSAIETWHKQPKFTAAERAKHGKAVAAACAKLLDLLEQVTPGGGFDDFSEFTLSEAEAPRLFDAFATPKVKRCLLGVPESAYFSQRAASHYLKYAGLDPVWAVNWIQKTAEAQCDHGVLPRKVRAATAYRTFMIREVASAISGYGSRRRLAVGDQAVADVVALLVNADCSIDDARKALTEWRAEDSAFDSGGIIPREK